MTVIINPFIQKESISSATQIGSQRIHNGYVKDITPVNESSFLITQWFDWEQPEKINKQGIIKNNHKIQRTVNLQQVFTLFQELKKKEYEVIDSKSVANFLTKNQFLAFFIQQTINELEKYYSSSLEKLYLELTTDPEEDTKPVLFIKIKTRLKTQKTFEILLQFNKEWFIPMAQDNILKVNIDFI